MTTTNPIPVTTCEARELRPGDTYVDVFGNEGAVYRVAVLSPQHLSLGYASASGVPCGRTMHPEVKVKVRVAPPGFVPYTITKG